MRHHENSAAEAAELAEALTPFRPPHCAAWGGTVTVRLGTRTVTVTAPGVAAAAQAPRDSHGDGD
jgi:hypothetical protein